jgi:hypothetical protein
MDCYYSLPPLKRLYPLCLPHPGTHSFACSASGFAAPIPPTEPVGRAERGEMTASLVPNAAGRNRRPDAACFPDANTKAGKQKTAPKDRLNTLISFGKNWSGRRDSNPRPQPWQGCALPLSYARALRGGVLGCRSARGKPGEARHLLKGRRMTIRQPQPSLPRGCHAGPAIASIGQPWPAIALSGAWICLLVP